MSNILVLNSSLSSDDSVSRVRVAAPRWPEGGAGDCAFIIPTMK